MKIAVIDGQGGGIGKHIMEKLRTKLPADTELIALGTNSLATAQMIKAGAIHRLQTMLQNYGNQNRLVLAQKQTCGSME